MLCLINHLTPEKELSQAGKCGQLHKPVILVHFGFWFKYEISGKLILKPTVLKGK